MKPVTCWYKEIYNKKTKRLEYKYNHLEDSRIYSRKPFSKFPLQNKNWAKAKWFTTFAYLNKKNEVVGEE